MIEVEVHSLYEIEKEINKIFADQVLCFRGQANIDWGLVPSIFREATHIPDIDYEYLLQCERDCHREFKEYGVAKFSSQETFEWLALEQHHGCPTRLLDWSSRFEVATFFALNSEAKSDAAVYALNLSGFPFHASIGRQMPQGGFRLEQIRKYCNGFEPIFTQPISLPVDAYLNPSITPPEPCFIVWRPDKRFDRLTDQNGLFSLNLTFGVDEFNLDHLQIVMQAEVSSGKELLLKVRIPLSAQKVIRAELYQKDIDEFTVYGGLDSLGKRVQRRHTKRILASF